MTPTPAANAEQDIDLRYILALAFVFLATGLALNPAGEILGGLLRINQDPSILFTDYIRVGGIGAALWNSALVILIEALVIRLSGSRITGTLLAAILTTSGFALFGTNVFNAVPIIAGTLLFARLDHQPANRVLLPAFFGTSLGPLVSLIAFGLELAPAAALPLAGLVGLGVGLVLPPLSSTYLRFHQGYNLYNLGFTSGIISTVAIAVLRMTGYSVQTVSILDTDHPQTLSLLCGALFGVVLALGLLKNGWKFAGLGEVWKSSGRLVSDFISLFGTGPTLINMGLMGLIGLALVMAVGARLNGPMTGALLTLVGFSAFGNHPRNSLPVMAGSLLASVLHFGDVNSTRAVTVGIFSTTLAPIAGQFGLLAGVVAGYLHTAVVGNVMLLHGGVNLYNNGFSGGFIAAFLVPLIEAFRALRDRRKPE